MEILVLNFLTLNINPKIEMFFHILIMFFIGGKGRKDGVDYC